MSEREGGAGGGEGRAPGRPLWGGRFAKPPAPEAHALGRSLRFDVRLASQDVEASIAHARGLEDAGLISAGDAAALEKALREVGMQMADGTFAFDDADEDIHSAVERGVTERLGDLGARLHAGRSRNDLVVTDLRLWLLAAARRIDGLTRLLARTLVVRAREHADTVMPGTTHGRPAQPVTLGHHLLAHAWACSVTWSGSRGGRPGRPPRRSAPGPWRPPRFRWIPAPPPRGSASTGPSRTRSMPCRTATSSRRSWPGGPSSAPTCRAWPGT